MAERWVSPKQLLDETAKSLGLPVPVPPESEILVLRWMAKVTLASRGSFRVMARLLGFKQGDDELNQIYETYAPPGPGKEFKER